MGTLRIFLITFLLGLGGLAHAQEASPTPGQIKRGIWRAELPGGIYIVRLTAITSLSRHQYVVDGNARVTEVNIGTVGSDLVRFYYIEPNTPQSPNGIGQSTIDAVQDRAKEIANRTGIDQVWGKVSKNYPTTTHAHTVEYRLETKDSLMKLFESVEKAWLNGDASTFKP